MSPACLARPRRRYACGSGAAEEAWDDFGLSWLLSFVLRFILVEPIIIVASALLPMLLATECCAGVCTERWNVAFGDCSALVVLAWNRLKRV